MFYYLYNNIRFKNVKYIKFIGNSYLFKINTVYVKNIFYFILFYRDAVLKYKYLH